MSMSAKLWLFVMLLSACTLLGVFGIALHNAQAYLQAQIAQKNSDNAHALALAMSATANDRTSLELYLNAQFETGTYAFIHLIDTEGEVIAARFREPERSDVPNWFTILFPINAMPGAAKVSDGWQRVGTLSLATDTRFAYRQLYRSLQQYAYYFALILLASAVILRFGVERLGQPLRRAVEHARALSEHRFLVSPLPRTREFREITHSLNQLTGHMQNLLQQEAKKLEKLRHEVDIDSVTGLLTRAATLAHFESLLEKEYAASSGSVLLIRIVDVFSLNQKHGRHTIDEYLRDLTALVKEQQNDEALFGRLNGSDFLLVRPGQHHHVEAHAEQLLQGIFRCANARAMNDIHVLISATVYQRGLMLGTLLGRLDSGVSNLNRDKVSRVQWVNSGAKPFSDTDNWTQRFQHALDNHGLRLALFPVCDADKHILHWEAPVRMLGENNEHLPAASFLPQLTGHPAMAQLDRSVVHLALQKIEPGQAAISVHISPATLGDSGHINSLIAAVGEHPEAATLLALEFAEHTVFQHLDNFKSLCAALRPYGCKIGIEHAGNEVKRLGALMDIGVNYIKIDRALVRYIHDNTTYQIFLRGLCTMIHSLGIRVYAEGVTIAAEWKVLLDLGFDGGTGSYFSDQG